ncbi:MAG TPA: methyltransferase domain-containing protein [Conexibacter sp.]|nr:methyltransferase domain-containing protein [Conexibacter sp.]
MSAAIYDLLGHGYSATRRADPMLAAAIQRALGDARSVVNVGAGIGSYEPSGRGVVAVEPASVMIAQRRPDAARAVQAETEAAPLPFADGSVDIAMAVLSNHRWRDRGRGLHLDYHVLVADASDSGAQILSG